MKSVEPVVLVVDDEPAMRRFVCENVDWISLGITAVHQAINGYDALAKVKALHPVLMVLDVKMPGMDGVSLLDCLRDTWDEPLSVIALSGYRDFSAAQKMVSNRMVTEYLLKPATPDELLDAARRSLEAMDLDFHEESLEDEPPKTRKDELVRASKIFIRDNFQNHVTLSDAAQAVHVSPAYLSRTFASADERGFNGYLSWYRVQRAKERLSATDDAVAGIAAQCGFGDVRHFLRVFKKVEGCTPSEFRNGDFQKGQELPPDGK